MKAPLSLEEPGPPIDTLRALGRQAFDHLKLEAMPGGGTIAVVGRPFEIEGVGSGLVEALEERGYRAWVGCHWLEGVRPPPGQAPSAYGVLQDYRDEAVEEVTMAILVQTSLFNPAIAMTALLWCLDNVPTKRFGLVSLLADQGAIDELRESVSFATAAPLDVSIGYSIDESERPRDEGYRSLHHLISDEDSQRDDRRFMPGIVAARREQRRHNRADLSNGPRRGT
ncbi:hypothetical protein [Fulvimarina sp. MAC8]|uniref:hypothetical protein n=1 Tax=Fulvimarina sp. MAC8 TaxID=3162874 RepID=UPI0032EC314F